MLDVTVTNYLLALSTSTALFHKPELILAPHFLSAHVIMYAIYHARTYMLLAFFSTCSILYRECCVFLDVYFFKEKNNIYLICSPIIQMPLWRLLAREHQLLWRCPTRLRTLHSKNIKWKAENRYTSFLWYPSDDLVVLLSGNQNKITKTKWSHKVCYCKERDIFKI